MKRRAFRSGACRFGAQDREGLPWSFQDNLGLAGAMVLGRSLAALLYGVRPTEPLLLAAVALVLQAASLAAMYLPARRASQVDPLVALKYE